MCRHTTPKTLCGTNPQFYQARLDTDRRFRLFLCKETQADTINAMSAQKIQSHKALARQCGLHFKRDALGRVLLHKFITQVKYLKTKAERRAADDALSEIAGEESRLMALTEQLGTLLVLE